jgi:muramoyltetrapeptide carboxypeptidase
MEMVRAPEVNAIFCARGGYGSGPLLSRLDPGTIREHPKILVGASDLTFLLNFFDHAGVVSFHGPMVATSMRNGEQGYDRTALLDLLMHRKAVQFPLGGTEVLRPGLGEGRLAGGCLSIVAATLGTPYEIDTRDKILFIEDIEEEPHNIDRMLTQLELAGKLATARGIIIGELVRCRPGSSKRNSLTHNMSAEAMLRERFKDYKIPVIYGLRLGHSKEKCTLPLGVMASITAAGNSVTLKLEEAATCE